MHYLSYRNTNFRFLYFFFFSVVLLTLLFYPSMENMQAYTEDHLHDAQTTNEKRIIISLSKERRELFPEPLSARTPSFPRPPTAPSAPPPSFRGDMMIRQSVPGQKKVVVRPRASTGQTNDHSSQVRMEGDKEIYEEEAVCKFCSAILKEDENILKTECCEILLLMHESCAPNQSRGNNPCFACGQEVPSVPVTLLTGLGSAQRMETQESNKQSCISRLIRCWKCGF